MAVLANINGHIHNQLTRSLERILEEANQSGELKLSNRKLKEFPKAAGTKYNLSDTVIADLSKNRFSELPEEVGEFVFLERLHCYHNAIRYIPDSISGLQCLNFLDLSRNQLTTLPREICQLPIQILLVSNNRLACLPDELSRMAHLTELDASCNQLTHLPPRMGELRSLQSLVLRNNLLLCVPVEVTYLSLTRLDLRGNRIGTLPVEMRNMTSLITLMVEDNPLTSPPASLCRRGQVHIFKYLEIEAIKLDRKMGITTTGTLGRKSRRTGATSSPGPPCHLTERLKHKRHNVDSGYSTSSDDKRWSQEGDTDKQWISTPILARTAEYNGAHSSTSTPSTISPTPDAVLDEEPPKGTEIDFRTVNNSVRLSPNNEPATNTINGNGNEEKPRPLHQIQTYREYKEALKQQRAQDVPAIYRTRDPDDHSYKTEPNTPTHYSTPIQSTISTSKSDPTPLNSAFGSPKHVFDDTKPSQRLIVNGNSPDTTNGSSLKYVKPRSPVKGSSGILSHDNVPGVVLTNGKSVSNPTKSSSLMTNGPNGGRGLNGVKTNRNITWNKDIPTEKMSFTMRREIDKAREETDLINQLRNIIETRLKMALPEDLAPALTDGVVLCHLANHIKPRSVASIHVPSPAVPKLTMARCRRNVDNFIEACRKIGVDEGRLCSSVDVTEALAGRGLPRLLDTVEALCALEKRERHLPQPPTNNDTAISLLLMFILLATVALLVTFPPPN